jgi:hypothetical protein
VELQAEVARLSAELEASQAMVIALQAEAQTQAAQVTAADSAAEMRGAVAECEVEVYVESCEPVGLRERKRRMSQDLKVALEHQEEVHSGASVELQAEVARLSAELEASQAMVIALQAEAEKPGDDALDSNEAVTKEESDRFVDLYDTDGSGTVEMEELLEMVAAFKQRESSSLDQAKIKEVWDADGDGMVSVLAAM